MRTRLVVAVGVLAVGLAASASAEEAGASPFGAPLSQDSLAAQRGGTDLGSPITNSLLQGNVTGQTSRNTGAISVANDAAKLSGTIYSASIAGNRGLTTVMQNTGDLVNLSNATNINVYIH